MNDYRPVALTSLTMKVFEQIILKHLLHDTAQYADPHQFAYRQRRSTEDAVLLLQHQVLSHLDSQGTSARILFVDFSSAFNTIQPHKMIEKLKNMEANTYIIRWICNFLTNRTQCVRLGSHLSSTVTTNTGAPQGCVISPALFSLYTADCKPIPSSSSDALLKYADDKALIGLITKDDDTAFIQEVNNLVSWCDENFLHLNPKKTKEMQIDFRRNPKTPAPLVIKGEKIEIVTSYKYLGITLENSLKWTENTLAVQKKASQRLYFLRKLKKFRVDKTILQLFYKSVIQSTLTYGLTCTIGNITEKDKKKLNKIIKSAGRVIGEQPQKIEELGADAVITKALSVLDDPTHPLRAHFIRAQSGVRYLSIKTKTSRLKDSFLPMSIRLLNNCAR